MPLKFSSLAVLVAISALFCGASSTPAHAYLDPGTGSMILQVLLGGAAGLALAGRLYWQRFMSLLGVKSAAPRVEDAEGHVSASSKPGADA